MYYSMFSKRKIKNFSTKIREEAGLGGGKADT